MKHVYCKTLLAFILAMSAGACLAGSGLRIICEGDADNAEVYINGKFKGECPLDLQVPEGMLRLRVQKAVDAQHDPRVFEQEIRMGDGVMKKVEVHLGAAELNAEGKRRQQEQVRQVLSRIETGMVAIPGKSYELGKYEVTQGQWTAIMGSNPSNFKNCGDNCPVEQVSWNAAQEFIGKLNAHTGKQYRLPTGAEWEYACYGGSKTEYCGGNNSGALGWYNDNSGGKAHPVGQKQANGYGLYDMSGNVWEWTQDCNDDGSVCVLRGGSWFDIFPLSKRGRAADRAGSESNYGNNNFGFRLARTLP